MIEYVNRTKVRHEVDTDFEFGIWRAVFDDGVIKFISPCPREPDKETWEEYKKFFAEVLEAERGGHD